jgi:hypothetical protein
MAKKGDTLSNKQQAAFGSMLQRFILHSANTTFQNDFFLSGMTN